MVQGTCRRCQCKLARRGQGASDPLDGSAVSRVIHCELGVTTGRLSGIEPDVAERMDSGGMSVLIRMGMSGESCETHSYAHVLTCRLRRSCHTGAIVQGRVGHSSPGRGDEVHPNGPWSSTRDGALVSTSSLRRCSGEGLGPTSCRRQKPTDIDAQPRGDRHAE